MILLEEGEVGSDPPEISFLGFRPPSTSVSRDSGKHTPNIQ